MKIYVDGIGLCGPGLPDWSGGREVLAGNRTYQVDDLVLTASGTLPAAERRRATAAVKLAIAVSDEAVDGAGVCAADTLSVFASSCGDGATITSILETLATDARELSPTRFHNSVHNAPAGYWGIATHSRESATSLCAFDCSFAAGLLEAACQALTHQRAVLLAAYDLPYPAVLDAFRPLVSGFGVGLLLSPRPSNRSVAECTIVLARNCPSVTAVADPAIEALRVGNPAARSLSLLVALAESAERTLIFDYAAGNYLKVALRPAAGGRW